MVKTTEKMKRCRRRLRLGRPVGFPKGRAKIGRVPGNDAEGEVFLVGPPVARYATLARNPAAAIRQTRG